MGKEDFLRMLVTQLNNQDPLNPLEGHDFAAQLAQFSSLEQLIDLKDALLGQQEAFAMLAEGMTVSMAGQAEALAALGNTINRSLAADLIGKTVEVPGNGIRYAGGEEPIRYAFELGAPAARLEVTIRNAEGRVVQNFPIGSKGAGRHDLWRPAADGSGEPLPPGDYTFDVKAYDDDGNPVAVTTLTTAPVERVSFGPDGVLVWVFGEAVPFDEVRSISPTVTPDPDSPTDPTTP